jgi:hypothetical protein
MGISTNMMKDINYTLLIILVILLIFCVSFYLYNGTNVSNIVKYDNFNNIVDNNTLLLELMNIAKINANKVLKEKFNVNTNLLLNDDAINYNNNVNAMQSWVDNSYNGEYGIANQILSQVKTANNLRNLNKQQLINLLTNIYIIGYINHINKQNAESYKMYLKYNNPNKNKYYTQYMK